MTETEPQIFMEILWYSDCIRGAIRLHKLIWHISNCVGLSRHGNPHCESLTDVLMRLFVINTLPILTSPIFKSNLPVWLLQSVFFLLKTPKDINIAQIDSKDYYCELK